MEKTIKIAVRTFGCKLNQFESMGIQEALENAGFQIVDTNEAADFYIINTCTVTAKTDRRSRQACRQVLQYNPAAKTIITGCGAQRDVAEFSSIPNVVAVIGNSEKNQIVNYVLKLLKPCQQIHAVSDLDRVPFQRIPITHFRNYSRAFVKIQEGCNRACSYCVIPSVRGPSRSQSQEIVINDITRLVNQQYREIVLTGIDLGTYGLDLSPPTTLLSLLKEIECIPSLGRIRLSSIEPMELNRSLIEKMTGSPKICRHFHIPLQSGSNATLKRMARTYLREHYESIIHEIKAFSPDACIGADVIVGFPGESDTDFESTKRFIENLPIDYLHVFSYSIRKGTPAADYSDQIEPKIIKQRCNTLRALGLQKAASLRSRLIGKNLPAIMLGEIDHQTGLHQALSDNYLRILLRGATPPKGTIAEIRLEKSDGILCYGRWVKSIEDTGSIPLTIDDCISPTNFNQL
ncbi:tRNA (N(6)-L-threonylcarbamoyladenosine(37)-C(2))-methylthiotransferase MtaB [bacterium]|nr:tRNA (N(6)-L-threonylcarbamoyladenosine(37)-C(2))-methylthiotransferase MtaB [candidate division CSSED10-310 bacterium]